MKMQEGMCNSDADGYKPMCCEDTEGHKTILYGDTRYHRPICEGDRVADLRKRMRKRLASSG